jgi:hypothetical protein
MAARSQSYVRRNEVKMAILLRGKTRCPICGNLIEEGDEAVLFPHFVLNEKDPLYALSDAACHRACVNADALGQAMLAAADEYYKRTGPGRRACAVCGNQILNPDEYLLIGYLADASTDPLGKFNYTHLHKSHIRDWKQANEFLALAKAAILSDRWREDALPKIIQEIEAAAAGPRARSQSITG